MNKYQEALDYVNKSVCTALSCLGVNDNKTKESLHTLQELVDKEKSPTIEEVKKEWEELGYEWKETGKEILLDNNIEEKVIRIYKSFKLYHVKALGENYFENASFALHQLLTKTFKALGWFND